MTYKSVTPDIGEETVNYTTPPRKWWEIHKYEIAELAALATVASFFISTIANTKRFFSK